MGYRHTKLNPAATSFLGAEPPPTLQGVMPPTPPPEESLRDSTDDMSIKTFDTTSLPGWALVEENEKLRVAALSLAKTSTRDEWIDRLQKFADLLAPGLRIGSTIDAQGRIPWKPLAVRQMPPPLQPNLATHGATFSLDFLQNELRGVEWSPGFYFIHPKDRRDDCKFTAYWILDADLDPYLPKVPGEHGAKLTPFFNSTLSEAGMAPSEEDYMDNPVFIGNNYKCAYRYFGHYSQTRFSDKLDYERMIDGTVPPFVLDVWAKSLASKDLEPWVKDALRGHIWPRPTYYGPLPLNSSDGSPSGNGSQSPVKDTAKTHDRRVQKATERFTKELQEWEIDSKLKFKLLTEADIHRLFRAADSDAEMGLRLWFEYLQCASYEDGLYERLVELKYNERLQRGYEARVNELTRQGWRWQLAKKVSGSGHTQMVHELCPALHKSTTPLTRKDSVTGAGQEPRASKSDEPGSKQVGAADMTSQVAQEKAAVPASRDKPSNSAPQTQTLPPHLRGRACKKEVAPAPTQAETAAATEPSRSATLQNGDLEEAKRMSSTFTKARSRRAGDSSVQGPARDQRAPARNDPMNRGWARAGRNPKAVPIDSQPDIVW